MESAESHISVDSSEDPLSSGQDAETTRRRVVESAIEKWKKELVDLSARNNLLYYKNLKSGTIDFSESEEILPRLLAGESIRLSSITDLSQSLNSLVKRAKTIRKKADVAFEEKGLEPMFLAYGMATWDESEESRKSDPAAPVCLIPAHLAEQPGGYDYELSLAGEARLNPTLLRKLESDFGVRLDSDESDSRLVEAVQVADLDRECQWLLEQADSVKGFTVNPSLVLGTFSYAKLPMVLDLGRATDELAGHDLISALAGDGSARDSLIQTLRSQPEPRVEEPDLVPPANENLVLDADSSQSFAINSVLAGQNAIIQGPPGTGKSQTIANLIAALIAEGKTVLFVAEKRAAIDAVFKRLNEVGLDHLLLDLHDGQKKRGAFAQELAQTIDRHRDQADPSTDERDRSLLNAREELNLRANAQHKARDPWGLSVYEARVRLAAIPEESRSDERIKATTLGSMDEARAREVRETIREWFQLGSMDVYSATPVWAQVSFGDEPDTRGAIDAATAAEKALASLQSKAGTLSEEMGIDPPQDLKSLGEILELCGEIDRLSEVLSLNVFDQDVSGLLDILEPLAGGAVSRSVAALSSGEYRAALRTFSELVNPEASTKARDRYLALEQAREVEEAWATLDSSIPRPTLPEDWRAVQSALDEFEQKLATLSRWLPGLTDNVESTGELSSALKEASEDATTVTRMVEIRVKEESIAKAGLAGFLEGVREDDLELSEALDRFDHIWLSSILEHLVFEDPKIQQTGNTLLVEEFKDLDRVHVATGAQKVRRACAVRLTKVREEHSDQDVLVARQSAFSPRSRKHLPVRRYFEAAPDVIRAAKPCWAMSPLVVSQTLPAKAELFDVVIFDEASQITPPDAVPSILRGKQLVVAGDTQQLPPTRFFLGTNEDEAEEEEELEDEIPVDDGTQNFESILDALRGFVSEKMLTWHYRSEDERLIAFSNAHIYDRRLSTFPGAKSENAISHELVSWEPSASDRSSSPDAEVSRVADLVVAHALDNPSESLGVIAMGVAHSNRISERLQQIRQEMSEQAAEGGEAKARFEKIEKLLAGQTPEPFFVKNLERVQGDERDVIFLSIGYGKDPSTGKMLYRFGPIAQEGGERRLNVAISRAKKRVVLVSSFSHLDMDEAKLTNTGPRLLKKYLEYADSGGATLGSEDDLPPELNAFEVQVRDALEAEGIALKPQHGVSGYRIDFAVKDPEAPGRYVLAIECDGASYHSSPTARERDRLRQDHLERLGWKFHRIWSTDWFSDPEKEVQRVLGAYESAMAGEEGGGKNPTPFEEAQVGSRRNPGHQRARRPRGYRSYDPKVIADLMRWIESDTLPRTRLELAEEAIEELGFARRGVRIDAAIDAALNIVRGPGASIASRKSEGKRRRARSPRPRFHLGDEYRPATPSESPASRYGGSPPTSEELRQLDAVQITYQRLGKQKPGKARVINPLEFKGRLMWAYCQEAADIRCFRIDRIVSWDEVPAASWPSPDWAAQEAKLRAHS